MLQNLKEVSESPLRFGSVAAICGWICYRRVCLTEPCSLKDKIDKFMKNKWKLRRV